MQQNILQRTHQWFQLAVPNPREKNFTTQLGVHIEEVAEMLKEVHGLDSDTIQMIDRAYQAVHKLGEHVKKNGGVYVPRNAQVKFLDALCDQIVTATGTAYMGGYDILGGMVQVNASNFSKFVNDLPVFDENFKIQKGPDYYKPNLLPFIPPLVD